MKKNNKIVNKKWLCQMHLELESNLGKIAPAPCLVILVVFLIQDIVH